MADIEQKVIIRAIDQVSKTQNKILENTKRTFDTMNKQSRKTQESIDGMRKSFISLKAVAAGVGTIVTGKLVSSFIKAGTEVEDLTAQFEVLLGSTENAKKRMEDLAKFAQTTPFKLSQVANASKVLETLTKGALAAGEGLRLVGDTAAARGADFDNLALHVGRAYDGLRNNRPVGESMMRLQELGIVTGGVRAEIESLTKQGLGVQAWDVLKRQLEENTGGMERMSKTVSGLGSTIKDQLSEVMRQMLNAGIWEKTQKFMTEIVSKLNEALDKGTFQRWGANILKVAENLDVLVSAGKVFFVAFAVSKIKAIEVAFKSFAVSLRASMVTINPVLTGLTVALGGMSIALDKLAKHADKSADAMGGVNKLTKEHSKILSEHLPKVIELDKKYGDAVISNRHLAKQIHEHKNAIDAIMGTGYTERFIKKSTEEQERLAQAFSKTTTAIKKQKEETGQGGSKTVNTVTTKEEFVPGPQKGNLLGEQILATHKANQEKINAQRIKFEEAQREVIRAEKEKELNLRYEIEEMMISSQAQSREKELAQEMLHFKKLTDISINEKAKNHKYVEAMEANHKKKIFEINKKYDQMRVQNAFTVTSNLLTAGQLLVDGNKDLAMLSKIISMGQITVNTAMGVSKALSMGPFGIPLAASIGALGAAQLVKASQVTYAAKGADFVTNGPQMLVVGDNPGGRERVQVTPESSPNINGPKGANVSIGNLSINQDVDFFEQIENNPEEFGKAFARALKRGALEGF